MPDIIPGLVAIAFAILFTLVAWRKYLQGNPSQSVLALLGLSLVLRVFVALDPVLHEWDERYHALVAKNMIEQPFKPVLIKEPVLEYDYRDWGQNHIWLHKQPFSLWAISLSIFLFGTTEIAVRIPSILISTLAVFCTFQIGKQLFDNRVGLLAAFFHAIHGLAVELVAGRVATDHIDVFFQALVEIAVLYAVFHAKWKRIGHLVVCGVVLGMAVLAKWLPALIVLPLWGILQMHFGGISLKKFTLNSVAILFIAVSVFLPWQLWIHTQFPVEAGWESQYNLRHFFEALEGQGRHPLYYLEVIRITFAELIYVPMIWLIYFSVKNLRKSYDQLFLAIWIFIPLIFYSIAQTKMPAYIFISAPAFFLLSAVFMNYSWKNYCNSRYRLLVYIVVGAMVLLPIRYSLERIKPLKARTSPQWSIELKAFLNQVQGGEKVIILNEPHYAQAMFYGNNIEARPSVPNQATIDSLLKLRYRLYLFQEENGNINYKRINRGN